MPTTMNERLLKVLCMLVVSLWLIAGCVSSASSITAASGVPRFEKAPCQFDGVSADWEVHNRVNCGWLHVEESRGTADSRLLKLWVAIARAPGDGPVPDPLLYIHGGPGIATVDTRFPSFVQNATWPVFRERRDVIFFDQRGTGRSQPEFCSELNDTLNAIDVEAPPADEALKRRVDAFTACRKKLLAQGLDFAAYNSRSTAADAEDLRRVLGYPAWNVYGVSYGTWVALELLRHHGEGVRTLILDSPYPPNSAFWAEESIYPTGKAYEVVERVCRQDPTCAARFPDIRSRLAAAVKRLDERPIERSGGRITGETFTSALWTLLVRGATVTYVPLVIDHAAAGDADLTRRFVETFGGAGGFGAYSFGQAAAVNCHESLAGRSERPVREAMRRYPFLIAQGAIAEAQDRVCDAWQPHRAAPETFSPVSSLKPVLLLTGEFDPSTPPEDAFHAARLLSNSWIVAVAGASHAPLHTDSCTRGIAHRFLENPDDPPALECLEQRPPFRFATEGLDEFLRSREKR